MLGACEFRILPRFSRGQETPRRNLVRGHHPTILFDQGMEQRFRRTPSPCASGTAHAQSEYISFPNPNGSIPCAIWSPIRFEYLAIKVFAVTCLQWIRLNHPERSRPISISLGPQEKRQFLIRLTKCSRETIYRLSNFLCCPVSEAIDFETALFMQVYLSFSAR